MILLNHKGERLRPLTVHKMNLWPFPVSATLPGVRTAHPIRSLENNGGACSNNNYTLYSPQSHYSDIQGEG